MESAQLSGDWYWLSPKHIAALVGQTVKRTIARSEESGPSIGAFCAVAGKSRPAPARDGFGLSREFVPDQKEGKFIVGGSPLTAW